MEGKKKPTAKDINQMFGIPDGAHLNDFAIPNHPIWKKTDAYIQKQTMFLDYLKELNEVEELEGKVSITLYEIENLKQEILLEINDNDSANQQNFNRKLFQKACEFKTYVQNFAKDEGIEVNPEFYSEYHELNLRMSENLGTEPKHLNNELSSLAIRIRDEVATKKRYSGHSFKTLFKIQDDYDKVIKLLEQEEFVEVDDLGLKWIKSKEGKDEPGRYLAIMYMALKRLGYLINGLPKDNEVAALLSDHFNFKLSKQVYSNALNSHSKGGIISRYEEFLPSKC